MRLRNVSPLGDLDIVGVGFVEAGAEFDVDDVVGATLADQTENFELAESTAPPSEPPAPPVADPAPAEPAPTEE